MSPSSSQTDRPSSDVVQVAAAGGGHDAVFAGVRALPVTELHLIHRASEAHEAAELAAGLEKLGLVVATRPVDGDFRSVFAVLAELAKRRSKKLDVHVNVSSGPRTMGSAALAGCFFHGLRAFEVLDGRPRFVPILPMSYSDRVGASKVRILQAIFDHPDEFGSLHALAEHLGMEKSLLSYHLRGNANTPGLEALGLVRTERVSRGRLKLSLSALSEFVVSASAPQLESDSTRAFETSELPR